MIRILKHEEGRKGSLKCVVSIVIPSWGNFVIEGIKMFESGNRKWFHFPCKVYMTEVGGNAYFHYNRFEDNRMHEEFHHFLFQALEEYLKKEKKS